MQNNDLFEKCFKFRMPLPIDLEDPNLRDTILSIIHSTVIRISGQGVLMY